MPEVADQTGLKEQKEIIESFRSLMSVPAYKEISLEKLFAEYCNHVAANCDTDGLEVDFDDGPHYESIEVRAEIAPFKERRSSLSGITRSSISTPRINRNLTSRLRFGAGRAWKRTTPSNSTLTRC